MEGGCSKWRKSLYVIIGFYMFSVVMMLHCIVYRQVCSKLSVFFGNLGITKI